MSTWYELLRLLRQRSGMSQRATAERAGLSPETISRLERGHTRRPAPRTLRALLNALDASPEQAQAIYADAGVDANADAGAVADEDALANALPLLNGYAWPCLLLNERLEIVAQNQAARLAGFDLIAAFPRPHERSLVRLVAKPSIAERLENWEALAEALAGAALARGVIVGRVGASSRYLTVLNEQLQADSRLMHARLDEIWRRSRADVGRSVLPVLWRAADGARLRFAACLSLWSARDGLWVLDCHPADAATAAWLAAQQLPAPQSGIRHPREGWSDLMQGARRAVGLTQRELAHLLGGESLLASLTSYESGRRRPPRARMLALAEVLELDLLTRNRILRGLGEAPPANESEQPAEPTEQAEAARAELRARVAAQTWPSLVVDVAQRCRIVAANAAFSRVYGDHLPENLVTLVLGRRFRRRALNWEEAAGAIVPSALKQALSRDAMQLPGWLRDALATVHREDAGALPQLRALFAGAALLQPAGRAVTPLVWRADLDEPLSFSCVVSRWSASGTLWAIDLYPADAESWQRLAGAI